jgi:hypothetical protein
MVITGIPTSRLLFSSFNLDRLLFFHLDLGDMAMQYERAKGKFFDEFHQFLLDLGVELDRRDDGAYEFYATDEQACSVLEMLTLCCWEIWAADRYSGVTFIWRPVQMAAFIRAAGRKGLADYVRLEEEASKRRMEAKVKTHVKGDFVVETDVVEQRPAS